MASKAAITRAIEKRKRGEDLMPEEEEALRQNTKQAMARAVRIYFDSDVQRAAYVARADDAGYKSFSRWVRDQLDAASHGELVDPSLVEDLRAEVADLREKLEKERDETEHYRTRARALEAKIEEYADEFFRIAAERGK